MHIMHVIDRLAVGGAERMLVDIANQSVMDGHQVSVCITRSGGELVDALSSGVALVELGRQRRFDWGSMRRLAALITERSVDVLHAHGRPSFSLLALMKTLRLVTIPILLHDHCGIELDASAPAWFRIEGRRQVAYYVGVYEKLEEWARRAGLPESRIRVIGNALNLDRFQQREEVDLRAEYGIPPGVPVGVAVASLQHCKGIDLLLQAVARHEHPGPLKLLLVGGQPDKAYAAHCRELSSSLALDDTIVFAGERKDVPALLQAADFGLMASRFESGPLVLIEYMASGLPFVSTCTGNIAAKARALGVPEFVPVEGVEDFAAALDRLLGLSPAERRQRGEVGREVARRHFDIREVIQHWYHVYNGVLQAA